jgi:HEAT repeat protein
LRCAFRPVAKRPALLDHDNVRLLRPSVDRLAKKGDLAGLLAVAEDESRPMDERRLAARVLGQIGDPRAVGPLIRAHISASFFPEARETYEALADIDTLVALSHDAEDRVAIEAIEALGRRTEDAAVNALIGLLDDADPRVRVWACEALGRSTNPAAREVLVSILERNEAGPEWSGVVAGALMDIDRPEAHLPSSESALIAIVRATPPWDSEYGRNQFGRAQLRAVLMLAKSGDERWRERAIDLLGDRLDDALTSRYRRRAEISSTIRELVVLGGQGAKDRAEPGLRALVSFLQDPPRDPENHPAHLRRWVVTELAVHGVAEQLGEWAVSPLMEALHYSFCPTAVSSDDFELGDRLEAVGHSAVLDVLGRLEWPDARRRLEEHPGWTELREVLRKREEAAAEAAARKSKRWLP